MSFARPGQLLVSRSFYEVVSCLSRDYASLFRHEGSRTDKHVRAHEVYAVVGTAPKPRMSEAETAGGLAPAASGPLGLRRSALAVAPLVFLLVVAGGVGARALLPAGEAQVKPAATKSEPVKPLVVAPAAGGAAAIETPKAPVARLEKKLEKARAEKPAAPQGPGRLELAVAPWGEVLVDGKSRGLSPPLRVLEVPAGTHTIEIRNSTFPAHVARVEVKAGEAVRIQHRFR
jgi:hypothetical protein